MSLAIPFSKCHFSDETYCDGTPCDVSGADRILNGIAGVEAPGRQGRKGSRSERYA